MKVTDPVVLVEVSSRSSRGTDAGAKLAGYFSIPSVRHYLILHAETRTLIHHARDGAGGAIVARILREGVVVLDPPGIRLDVPTLFDPPGPRSA